MGLIVRPPGRPGVLTLGKLIPPGRGNDFARTLGADGEVLSCASPLAPGASLRIRVLPGVLRVIS